MVQASVNFNSVYGKIKPMHSVNNGPIRASSVEQTRGNFDTFSAAQIPYVRNHDASFCGAYGGEHTVDIHAVFPDFSKNPYDPHSYDFALTDDYLQSIVDAGSAVFYRLGSKIEHSRVKYGTVVPADFHKWAVICEHIIRHYNEGWANGFRHNILYWEIWNEPDGVKSNGDQPNWSGTPEEFYEFYAIAAAHLKERFPHLKIGGPAVSWITKDNGKWTKDFLSYLTADGKHIPLDFLSWHAYMNDPNMIPDTETFVRKLLTDAGYAETESILNEYNYIENWTTHYISSIEAIIGMHGAAFTAACMTVGQASTLDVLMYYDARPCVFNGLFDFYTLRPLKGYYPFLMFSRLYTLRNAVVCTSNNRDLYIAAAENDGQYAVMLTYYRPKVRALSEINATVCLTGVPDGSWQAEILDHEHTMEKQTVLSENGKLSLHMQDDCIIFLTRSL